MTVEEAIKILELNVICSPKAIQFKEAVEVVTSEINRQKAELELKKAEVERLKVPKFLVKNTLSEKEISEILKKGRTGVIPHIQYSIKRIDEDSIKAEAVKEFAYRLKEGEVYMRIEFPNTRNGTEAYIVLSDDIDNLVKEMVGDSK